MKGPESKSLVDKLKSFKRKPVDISEGALVNLECFRDQALPLVIRPAMEGVDLLHWTGLNRTLLREKLHVHGGLLFRGFALEGVGGFEQFMKAVWGELLEYRERSSPRSKVAEKIYTSTEYPADQRIFLHNENSYQRVFPLQICFFCVTPAAHGGETPLADVRKVYQRIPAEVRAKFEARKVMYVRNFGEGFGLSWQTVFQTEDKAEVERYCQEADIQVEWKPNNGLRTRQIRPAVGRHPRTGETVWFNHATFFHVSTLGSPIRQALLREFKEEDLPNNTYYGDGSAIEDRVLEQLREIYEQETVSFPWQKGDVLMLENMLVAHGRAAFEGERKIVVGMAEPSNLTEG